VIINVTLGQYSKQFENESYSCTHYNIIGER